MAKKKKRITISTTEAIARLDRMAPILYRNMQSALCIEATMVVGNNVVGEMTNRTFPGARSFNRIMRSLAYDLAMHLARLYDIGNSNRHPNRRDVASIPLAFRLLRQRRCEKALCQRARSWLAHDKSYADVFENDCRNAIARSLAGYSKTIQCRDGRQMVQTLKEFRDVFMAHSLMKESDVNPIYNQLFHLTDFARDFVQDALLAIEGKGDDLKEHERIFTNDASRFWRMALLGERDENENLPDWANENA